METKIEKLPKATARVQIGSSDGSIAATARLKVKVYWSGNGKPVNDAELDPATGYLYVSKPVGTVVTSIANANVRWVVLV